MLPHTEVRADRRHCGRSEILVNEVAGKILAWAMCVYIWYFIILHNRNFSSPISTVGPSSAAVC
jgi:hypothetical protein